MAVIIILTIVEKQKFRIYIVGGRGPKWLTSSYGGDLEEHRQIVLGRYALNSYLDYTTIADEDAEDVCLTSNGRETKSEGAWGKSRGNKGNLVLNKEEKKKKVQDGCPLRIKCTTNHLAGRINKKMTLNSITKANTQV